MLFDELCYVSSVDTDLKVADRVLTLNLVGPTLTMKLGAPAVFCRLTRES